MNIFSTTRKISPEVPMSFFNFERFERQGGDFVFVDARINFRALEEIKDKKIVYFEIEEPNRFSSLSKDFRREEYEWYFYKILSVCPYTTEWLNRVQKNNRRQFVFFPFDKKLMPIECEKRYDVVYFGSIHSREILDVVRTISKFNYRFIAPSEEKIYRSIYKFRVIRKLKAVLKLNYFVKDKYLTDKNVTNQQKLKIIAQSKITIVHNLLFIDSIAVWQTQKLPNFKDNKAFDLIPPKNILRSVADFFCRREYIVPQQKTRLFEAAFCKSLILCRKDPFNVVEKFFVPGREFLYYDKGKLNEKLTEILANYDSYKEVVENAYTRAINEYTTDVFFNKYLKNLN